MKKTVQNLVALLVAATFMYSCSSSKNIAINGSERAPITKREFTKAAPLDQESLANYASVAASQTANPELATAVASTKAVEVVVAPKPASEKAVAAKTLTKAELKAAVKEVIKSKSIKNALIEAKKSEGKGMDNQTIAIILSLVSLFFFANSIALHRWYMYFGANHKPSLLVAILDLVFAITILLWIVSVIWGIIDIIRLLTGSLKV
jgi:hypothetical protein